MFPHCAFQWDVPLTSDIYTLPKQYTSIRGSIQLQTKTKRFSLFLYFIYDPAPINNRSFTAICFESLAGLWSCGAERIYRSAPAATDCHWSSPPSRASGPSFRCETGGGATGGATGPIPEQPVGTSIWAS